MNPLEQKIKAANNAYSIGQPYLTDAEYDQLWQELHAFDPHNPLLYHTSKDPTIPSGHVRHIHPIRGTQKAFTMEDLKPFLTRFKGEELVIQPKYDGVAAVIYKNPYNSGYPTGIVLFGDGIYGRDISYHAPRILHNTPPTSHTRVELIIRNDDWDESYGKNPRNTVAGWVNSSEIKHPDIITAWEHDHYRYNHYVYAPMAQEAFTDEYLLRLYNKWSAEFPMDGLMIKVADPKLRLTAGDNGTFYHWSIAWKPPIQTKQARVVDIHWNVSRNGRVKPKVEYEPIELCGTTNRFATGNNAQWITDKGISTKSVITVGKAGEIIPKIISVDLKGMMLPMIPDECPICGTYLKWKGVDLICDSSSCIVQLSKSLAYFYSDKGMDVKGIGEAMIIELLYDPALREILNNSPWALLDPRTYDLFSPVEQVWGELRMNSYMEAIHEVSGKKDPARFIAALGYPGLAYKTALKVFQAVKGHGTKANISSKAVINFSKAFGEFAVAKKMLQSFQFAPLPLPAKVTYCITGELFTPRNDMIDYLTTKGWQFSNQVSKHTDVLIIGYLKRESTKQAKAKEIGTKMIYESELAEYIKEKS